MVLNRSHSELHDLVIVHTAAIISDILDPESRFFSCMDAKWSC